MLSTLASAFILRGTSEDRSWHAVTLTAMKPNGDSQQELDHVSQPQKPAPTKHRSRSSWTPSLKKVLRGNHHHHERQPSLSGTTAGSSTSPSSIGSPGGPFFGGSAARQASPPNDLIPSNSSSMLAKLPEDDFYSPPIDMTPPSPGTPQKLWERQYRTFLSRKRIQRSTSRDELDESSATRDVARRFPVSNSSNNNNANVDLVNGTVEESSVRGGQFFASVFAGKAQRKASKSKSQDELDGTMRRGSERGLHSSSSSLSSSYGNAYPRTSSSLPNFQAIPRRDQLLHHQQPPVVTAKAIPGALRSSSDHLFPQQQSLSSMVLSETLVPLNDLARPSDPSQAPTNSSTQSAMKRAFTEFHNVTGRDAASAFLGDDPSHHPDGKGFDVSLLQSALASTSLTSVHNGTVIPPLSTMIPRSLPVATDMPTNTASSYQQQRLLLTNVKRVLKPLVPVESWQSGRRYVIAPAVWSACPMGVMAALTRNSSTCSPKEVDLSSFRPFGTIILGQCVVMSISDGTQQNATLQNDEQWSPVLLVLRQNYLLEYGPSDPLGGMPRGYAHLQYATCCMNTDVAGTLELDFYGSPCAKSDRRRLLIRPSDVDACQHWLKCFNSAGSLRISDLYDYDESAPLGTGSYASVFAAKRKCPDAPDNCAIKVFCKTMFWRCVIKGRERADTIVREVSVQATLTARCSEVQSFLRIRGLFETTDHVVIESEFLDGTDLFRYISSRPRATEAEAACILYNILLCLRAMNRIGLSHRDIKPANILVCHTKLPLIVKVADFGLATFVGVDGKVNGRCGTPGYVAPEIFRAGVHGAYSKKVDVFSAGVTLYVMLCGYEPFYGETDSELIRANKEAVVEFPAEDWKTISASAQDLVTKMMLADANKRLSVEQAITHPWIIDLVHHQGSAEASPQTTDMPTFDACTIS